MNEWMNEWTIGEESTTLPAHYNTIFSQTGTSIGVDIKNNIKSASVYLSLLELLFLIHRKAHLA